jgi:hypothetical protein
MAGGEPTDPPVLAAGTDDPSVPQVPKRLMRGVDALAGKIDIALYVVSAGYGLVPGDRRLSPYEFFFIGRRRDDL